MMFVALTCKTFKRSHKKFIMRISERRSWREVEVFQRNQGMIHAPQSTVDFLCQKDVDKFSLSINAGL